MISISRTYGDARVLLTTYKDIMWVLRPKIARPCRKGARWFGKDLKKNLPRNLIQFGRKYHAKYTYFV
jgi:hypothetical protein